MDFNLKLEPCVVRDTRGVQVVGTHTQIPTFRLVAHLSPNSHPQTHLNRTALTHSLKKDCEYGYPNAFALDRFATT